MNTSTRGLISTIAGIAALAFLVMALIYWALFVSPAFSFTNADWTLRILALAAIISFTVYILVAPESVGTAAGKRSNRLTANAVVASVVAIAIGVVANMVVQAAPGVRADWTAGKEFTLSQQTIKVLQDIDARNADVEAVGFFDPRNPQGQQEAEDLLKEYSSHTSKLRYRIVDPYANPTLAAQYGITRLGVVVFAEGTRRQIANTADEREFTGALLRLAETEARTVAFLVGHGERDPENFEARGYGQIAQSLEQNNYRVTSVNLVTATLTVSDVSVLVIAEPIVPISAQERQTIQGYLDSGGRVMMMLDPLMPSNAMDSVRPILERYGVNPVQGGVIDLARSLSPQDPTDIYVNQYPQSDITADFGQNNLATRFRLAMAVQPPTSTVQGFTVAPLLQTSGPPPQSWLETAIQPVNEGSIQLNYDEGTDLGGPVTFGVQVQPAEAVTATVNTRLVVIGDSDFASNQIIGDQLPIVNIDLFGNAVSWLAGANELVSIRPKEPTAPRTMVLDNTQKNLIFTASVLVLPLLVFLLGIFNWWRRR